MNDIDQLDGPPEIHPDIDDAILGNLPQTHPAIVYLLKQMSVQKQGRTWLNDRVVRLNNASVAQAESLKEIAELLRKIADQQEERDRGLTQEIKYLKEELTRVKVESSNNAKVINDWIVRFKSPLTVLGTLAGIIVTAVIGAVISRLLGK